tara:strand:+ start:17207 stop:20389 length:3183 start_codon:yes stop_codon:yes gene_type:complete
MTTPTFTSPPAVTPTRGSATFAADASAWVTWQSGFEPELSVAVPWFAARVVEVAQSVTDATAQVALATTQVGLATDQVALAAAQVTLATAQANLAAASATAASVTANATVWVSGSDYAQFANVVSPIDAGTYRSKVAITNSVVDPSSDLTRFALISNSGGSSFAALTTSAVTALTPAATVDINLADTEYFKLAVNQATALTTSNVKTLDTFNLSIAGLNAAVPYDLPATTYDQSKQLNVPQSKTVQMSPDGLNLFALSRNNDRVYSFTLSTAYDTSTVTADTSFSTNAQEGGNTSSGLFVRADGLKMYVLGDYQDRVYSYTLSTSWDLSSASYDNKNFLVRNEDTLPTSLQFKPDGLKMYVLGKTTDSVFQYSLTTAWDVTTASYDSVSFSFNPQEAVPFGFVFDNTGTRLFMCGGSEKVFEYSLTTAYDVSTISYSNIFFSTASQLSNPESVHFSSNGAKMYISNLDTTVYQYSTEGVAGAAITYPSSFDFVGATPASPVTGETLVLEAETTDGGTTFNVKVGSNPANVVGNMDLEANDFFSLDLTDHTGFSVTNTADDLSTFNLEVTGAVKSFTTLDFSAPTEIGKFNVSAEATNPQNIKFTDDGLTYFVGDDSTDTVYKYTLTKAFDITTSVYSGVSLNLSNELSSLRSLYFADSGTKLYAGGNSNNVYQYDMTTAYDLTTATFNQVASMASSTNIYCMSFKPDGLVFYVGQNQATLQTYTLTTAFDLTTASYQAAHNFSAQVSNISDFWLSLNGTKLLLLAYQTSGRKVFSYDLTNAYDMTTAIYNSGIYTPDSSNSFGLEISLDETTLYLAQSSPVDQILAISLSVDTFVTTSFPASFNFNSGVEPSTLIAGERLILEAQTTDGGANWYLTDLTTPAVDIKVGMVPLLTQKVTTSGSSIAAIDFTLTGDYNNYMVIWDNCLPVTDQATLDLRMSNNKGISYCNNYKQVYPYQTLSTAGVILGTITLTGSVGNANNAGEFCAGSINLHVKNTVGVINRGTVHGTSMQISGSGVFQRNVIGGVSNEEPGFDANAIRINFNNGNVASGTFTLYGMNGA